MRDAPASISYSTDGTQGLRVAYGIFICLAGLIPSTIVAVQWLTSLAQPTQGGTNPLSIIPGVLIVLYGVWTAAWREVVTVDPSAKTLQWTRSVFQFVLKKELWQREEIKAIEIRSNSGLQAQGFRAQVTGPRGTRMLLSYFHSKSLPPEQIRKTGRMLELESQ